MGVDALLKNLTISQQSLCTLWIYISAELISIFTCEPPIFFLMEKNKSIAIFFKTKMFLFCLNIFGICCKFFSFGSVHGAFWFHLEQSLTLTQLLLYYAFDIEKFLKTGAGT